MDNLETSVARNYEKLEEKLEVQPQDPPHPLAKITEGLLLLVADTELITPVAVALFLKLSGARLSLGIFLFQASRVLPQKHLHGTGV